MISLICEVKKKDTYEIQNRNRPTDTENKVMVTKGERQRRDELGGWD